MHGRTMDRTIWADLPFLQSIQSRVGPTPKIWSFFISLGKRSFTIFCWGKPGAERAKVLYFTGLLGYIEFHLNFRLLGSPVGWGGLFTESNS